MINGIVDELIELGGSLGCDFSDDYKEKIIATMKLPPTIEGTTSVMYQDFLARRPMEIETFLGSPIKLAKRRNMILPRLEVVYALLHDKNQRNLKGETPPSPGVNPGLPPRTSSMQTGGRPPMNGIKNRGGMANRAPSLTGPHPAMRRGPYANGYRMGNGSQVNGFGPHGGHHSQRDSGEGEVLEDFSHVMLYEGVPDGGFQDGSSGSLGEPSGGSGTPSGSELALKERELALRQRELELKEREQHMHMRRGPPPRRIQRPPTVQGYDDEDQEDDYFDPMSGGHAPGQGDDNIDMMSITSRRNRKMPSNNYHHQPHPPRGAKNVFARKNRSSTRLMQDMPSPHESIMNNPLLGYSSNRYGTVDRQALEAESRQNSMTGPKMEEMARAAHSNQYGPIRRPSQSPGNPLSPIGQRPSPPNGFVNGMRPGPSVMNGRPSPPGGVRQPFPKHPAGHGNILAPQPVEQHVGVSTLYPPKSDSQVRSLTGSASASAKSGESASANTGSVNSAASSSSSLQPRPQQVFVAVPP
jgi:Ketopantoate reductase PanE/ApbA C terminal